MSKGPATRNDFVNDIVDDARANAIFATLKTIVDDIVDDIVTCGRGLIRSFLNISVNMVCLSFN